MHNWKLSLYLRSDKDNGVFDRTVYSFFINTGKLTHLYS